MQEKVFSAETPDDLAFIAKDILRAAGSNTILVFYGGMGAGKTTLIKALCRELGVTDTVASPTFSILNEYHDGKGNPVYHFDFYRIKNESEAYDMGYESYFFSGQLCLIEWPEKINSLLNCTLAEIRITVEQQVRKITVRI